MWTYQVEIPKEKRAAIARKLKKLGFKDYDGAPSDLLLLWPVWVFKFKEKMVSANNTIMGEVFGEVISFNTLNQILDSGNLKIVNIPTSDGLITVYHGEKVIRYKGVVIAGDAAKRLKQALNGFKY